MSGETMTINIPAGAPVVVKPVAGAIGVVGNACGYSVDGSVPVQLTVQTNGWRSTKQRALA